DLRIGIQVCAPGSRHCRQCSGGAKRTYGQGDGCWKATREYRGDPGNPAQDQLNVGVRDPVSDGIRRPPELIRQKVQRVAEPPAANDLGLYLGGVLVYAIATC